MSEVVFFSSDLDFLEGMDEPGELIWTGDSWSFADVTVATPFNSVELLAA